jgi:2'-5' RNA ligase
VPSFAFDADDRERWAKITAGALAALALSMRTRIAGKLGTKLPTDGADIWQAKWWTDGLANDVQPVYAGVAAECADAFHTGAGFGDTPDRITDIVAAGVAAAVVSVMGDRGDIVANRIDDLLATGAEQGRDAEWLAEELALATGDGGPLSDRLMRDYGAGASTGLREGTASAVLAEYDANADRTWNCVFINSRDTHMDADQQVAGPGEDFDIGGFPAAYPMDPRLPIEEAVNCQCYLSYEVKTAVADNAGTVDVGEIDSGAMDDNTAAASLVRRTFPNGDRFYGTKAMARRITAVDMRAITYDTATVTGVAAAAGAPDHTDGIAVTIEPTAAEKKMLAVAGGLPPAEIHCTLAYLGTTAELTPEDRATVATIIANVGAAAPPFEGSIAGVGWFGAPDGITLYLVDSTDLAAFRTAIVAALVDVDIPVAMDHGFIPHITAAYAAVPEADGRAGMPVHFNDIRCRWGTEVLVADLLGGETPPPPVADQPAHPPAAVTDTPPTPPAAPTNGASMAPTHATAGTVTADTVVAPEAMPVDPDTAVEPADPADLPDDAIIAEVARRAAEAATVIATDNGAILTNDDVAAIHAAAEENTGAMFDQLVEACVAIAGTETDDGDWETSPDGAPTMLPLGGQEGYTANPATPLVASGGGPGTVTLPNGTRFITTGGMTFAAATGTGAYHRGAAFAIEGIRPAPDVSTFDFEGPVTVEGIPSGDSRMFAEGALDWRQLPVPLAFLDRITSEHQEGELAGWWHRFERRDNGAIWGYGTYAPTEAAERMKAILADPNGPGRYGVSVDVDSVNAVYSTPDGTILDPMEAKEAYCAGDAVMMMMVAGRISGVTAVMHPAFMEAQVWNVGPVTDATPIAASAGIVDTFTMSDRWRSMAPGTLRPITPDAVAASAGDPTVINATAPPPAAWFALDTDLLDRMVASKERGAFDVMAPDDRGRIRVFGIVSPPNECHIGLLESGRCQTMPRSRDFSRFYATGAPDDPWAPLYSGTAFSRFYADAKAVRCEGGERIVVGPVILDNVHPNLRLHASDTQPWYAHTGSAVADVTLHMTPHGLVAAGAVRPGVSWIDVYKLGASSVSPDWRPLDGENKVMAILAVNVSGFQLALAASGGRIDVDAITESQERVGALVASAGVAHGRRRMVDEIAALRTEVAELRDGVRPIIARDEIAARRVSTSAALDRMGVRPRVEASVAALASMGVDVGTPPCGCND